MVPTLSLNWLIQSSKPPIESAELYNLAKELFRHPSKYADIIRNIRERSELQSTPTNRADLTGADLTDVIRTMRQRSWPQDALVDTSKVNIFNPPDANPTNANLSDANLSDANPTNANLSDANPTNAKLIIYDNSLSGIKLYNVEADNRIIFQNAKPTSASPSSIVTDTTTRPIVKESADRPSIHKITRYTSDGKPINQ